MSLRRSPLRQGSTRLQRGNRIAARSERTIADQPVRDAVRKTSLERAGHKCQMAELIPEVRCGGRLEVDEFEGRGAHPGSHLDAQFTQVGCRAHHQWKTEHPQLALERGLRAKSSFERRRNMLDE